MLLMHDNESHCGLVKTISHKYDYVSEDNNYKGVERSELTDFLQTDSHSSTLRRNEHIERPTSAGKCILLVYQEEREREREQQ